MSKSRRQGKNSLSACAGNAGIVEGSLRVWHIPQVPGKPFHVPITGPMPISTAIDVLDTLARYDLFQYENKIKPDYANAQGLEIFEDGEWVEWTDDDGYDIGDLKRQRGNAS